MLVWQIAQVMHQNMKHACMLDHMSSDMVQLALKYNKTNYASRAGSVRLSGKKLELTVSPSPGTAEISNDKFCFTADTKRIMHRGKPHDKAFNICMRQKN